MQDDKHVGSHSIPSIETNKVTSAEISMLYRAALL